MVVIQPQLQSFMLDIVERRVGEVPAKRSDR